MDLDEDENRERRRLEDLKEKSQVALMENGSLATNHDKFVRDIMHYGKKGSQ